MSLHKCEVIFDIIVDALNKEDAVKLAKANIQEEISNTDPPPINVTIRVVKDISDLSDDWLDAIPWNNDNHDKTCSEILMEGK